MKLVEIKCPNCGSKFDVNENKKNIKCKYCDTTVVLDDEILHVEYKVIDNDIEKLLKKANVYLEEFKDYKKAYNVFKQITEEYPYEAEAWYGLILSLTENYRFKEIDVEIFDECNNYIDKYEKIEKNKKLLDERIKEYKFFVDNNKVTSKNLIKKELKKSMKLIMIPLTIIVVLIVGVFVYFGVKNYSANKLNKEREEFLLTIGKVWYKQYYNSVNIPSFIDDEEAYKKHEIKRYVDKGVHIDLKNLRNYRKTLLFDYDFSIVDSCDLNNTKVNVYPKEPFGPKDYTIEVELSC